MARDENGLPFEVHSLRYGDSFGYSDLLKIMVRTLNTNILQGPEYLGVIKVSEKGGQVECLMIEEPDLVIELYERNILSTLLAKDYETIKLMTETRH